jgi:hypothetical protein
MAIIASLAEPLELLVYYHHYMLENGRRRSKLSNPALFPSLYFAARSTMVELGGMIGNNRQRYGH